MHLLWEFDGMGLIFMDTSLLSRVGCGMMGMGIGNWELWDCKAIEGARRTSDVTTTILIKTITDTKNDLDDPALCSSNIFISSRCF